MNTFVTSDTISVVWLFWFWKWYINHFKRTSWRTARAQPGISRPMQSSLNVQDRFRNRGDHDSMTQPQSELKVRLTNQHTIDGKIVCQDFKVTACHQHLLNPVYFTSICRVLHLFDMMIFQVDLTSSLTSYNLSSDLKRSKRARWQGDKSTCQVKLVKLTILSGRTCHCKWNLSPIKTICHITPRPHPFHCTNSHEATQVVHRKWGSTKREDPFIIVAEHLSEFVDCE